MAGTKARLLVNLKASEKHGFKKGRIYPLDLEKSALGEGYAYPMYLVSNYTGHRVRVWTFEIEYIGGNEHEQNA